MRKLLAPFARLLLVLCLARTTSSHDRLSASKPQVLLLRCQVAKLIRTAKSQLRTLQASLLVRKCRLLANVCVKLCRLISGRSVCKRRLVCSASTKLRCNILGRHIAQTRLL